MADVGVWEDIVEIESDQAAYNYQCKHGLLEEIFVSSDQAFRDLGPELRLRSVAVFHQVLQSFDGSGYDAPLNTFRPQRMVEEAYRHAIGQRGKDCVITKFFHFLTFDANPIPTTPDETLQRISSIVSPPRTTRQAREKKDWLLRRVRQWALFLLHTFFRPFQAVGGTTIPVTTPPGFSMSLPHSQVGTSHRHTDLRRRCMVRDHHRCVITRRFDTSESIRRLVRDRDAKEDEGNLLRDIIRDNLDRLEVAHIIPHALNAVESEASNLSTNQKLMRGVLDMFDPTILNELDGAEIDRPRNAITLTANMHEMFGKLNLFFQPTAAWTRENQEYDVRPIREEFLFDAVTRVLLEGNREEMPSRRYLELHAACAHICYLSGAGEYTDKLNDDLEWGEAREDGGTDIGALVVARLVGTVPRGVRAY
ncbi:MAG: hypothetical protein M1837_002306 [Sclerophora amabilis]|nr:MAG: hypothetical protein M1837_002306 [Sclerophora amabilis]